MERNFSIWDKPRTYVATIWSNLGIQYLINKLLQDLHFLECWYVCIGLWWPLYYSYYALSSL